MVHLLAIHLARYNAYGADKQDTTYCGIEFYEHSHVYDNELAARMAHVSCPVCLSSYRAHGNVTERFTRRSR